MWISAVGALPMAKIRGRSSFAAFSMACTARVEPAAFAASATSSSPMKQKASPPCFFSAFLLMPDMAMVVSVTMAAPS